MSSKETVNLNASSYDWSCSKCDHENITHGISLDGNDTLGEVKCEKCKETFNIGTFNHSFNK